jgi:hypothetical protein
MAAKYSNRQHFFANRLMNFLFALFYNFATLSALFNFIHYFGTNYTVYVLY